jgi:hypothetical protein
VLITALYQKAGINMSQFTVFSKITVIYMFLMTDAKPSASINRNPRQAGAQLIGQELPSIYGILELIFAFRRPCNLSIIYLIQCQTLPGVQTAFS